MAIHTIYICSTGSFINVFSHQKALGEVYGSSFKVLNKTEHKAFFEVQKEAVNALWILH